MKGMKGGYHHDEEDLLLGAGAPPKGAAPSSPIKPPSPPSFTHFLVLPFSRKVAAPNPSWLSEALPDC
jgi:hypothetical protein